MIKLLKRDIIAAGYVGLNVTVNDVTFRITCIEGVFKAVSVDGTITRKTLKDIKEGISKLQYDAVINSYMFHKLTAFCKASRERVTLFSAYSKIDCSYEKEEYEGHGYKSEDYKSFNISTEIIGVPPCLNVYDAHLLITSNLTLRIN